MGTKTAMLKKYTDDMYRACKSLGWVARESVARIAPQTGLISVKVDIFSGYMPLKSPNDTEPHLKFSTESVNGDNISRNPEIIKKLVDEYTKMGYTVDKFRPSYFDFGRGATGEAITLFVKPVHTG